MKKFRVSEYKNTKEPRFKGEVSERTHRNMSHIRGKDTSIEIAILYFVKAISGFPGRTL